MKKEDIFETKTFCNFCTNLVKKRCKNKRDTKFCKYGKKSNRVHKTESTNSSGA